MSLRATTKWLRTGSWSLAVALASVTAQGEEADSWSDASGEPAPAEEAPTGAPEGLPSDPTGERPASAGNDDAADGQGTDWVGTTAPVPVELSQALAEAALDLGIVAQVVDANVLDRELQRRPRTGTAPWLIGHRLAPVDDQWRVEVTAVPPDSEVRRVAVDVVEPGRIEVRAMVLLRETVQTSTEQATPTTTTTVHSPPLPPPRSTGRAVLALNTALLGGAIGVSLHLASSSEDDRLLYPLAALGVGIGLGASMLIADEWDITTDDAWFLSAGMVWPAVAGLSLSAGYDVREEHRYLYGLSGTAVGLTLATMGVAQGRVFEGSATLAHSGAAFGLGMGALTEGIVRGDLVATPLRGMGYGTGAGVLAAGILATQVETSSSRVLLVDLAALLGGLTGGAVATPLLLVDDVTDTHRRLWFGSIALGTGIGGLLGILATPREQPNRSAASAAGPRLVERWAPQAGVIGFSEAGTRREPAFGAGVQGLW